MKYHFKCPNCGGMRSREWADRDDKRACPNPSCRAIGAAPTPDRNGDPAAYVDQHDPPDEMENAVYAGKGFRCTVPGCKAVADALDHRIPFDPADPHGAGRTSYENLFPMCTECNSSKGDTDYDTWRDSR